MGNQFDKGQVLSVGSIPPTSAGEPSESSKTVNESAWDRYSMSWPSLHPSLKHLGDEWIGLNAGAAKTLEEYQGIIKSNFIDPWINPNDTVIEIGVGGGKTTDLLLRRASRIIAADVSAEMLNRSAARHGNERVSWVKLDGYSLDAIPEASADALFCFDTMVHIEPRDIFNYLVCIPKLLRGPRICILHHTNTVSDLGFKKFLTEWRYNLGGSRSGTAFSVMTDAIMEKFLSYLGYEVLLKDMRTIPRDCVWVCRAPENSPSV